MQHQLIQYFSKFTRLSPEEESALTQSMLLRTFPKHHYLLREGEFSHFTYFVLTGCVRQFKLVDGEDITTHFFTENQWIISMDPEKVKIAASINLICMEDTTLVIGDEQKAQALFEQFPRLERVSRQVMETVYLEQQQFLATYITHKPEQRYLQLLQSRPDLFNRVPQYDIASYLGIKPESLSRIRKKLQQKSYTT
jgi:CRP-like cAMP-binding protein